MATSVLFASSNFRFIAGVGSSGPADRSSTAPAARVSLLALLAALLAVHVQSPAYACIERKPTPQTGPGPHDFSTAPAETRLWREGDGGVPLFLRARVLDTCGDPVPRARIQILHADQDGVHDPHRWRARLESNDRGEFEVLTVYPGYAGSIARHIHFIITHPDHQRLVTRLFFKNDPAAHLGIEDLAIVLEEVRRDGSKAWMGGYEFVLAPR